MPRTLFVLALVTALLSYQSLTGLMTNSLDNKIIQEADAAAVDYFLKIEGVAGESTDSKHKDWIEVESFSFGATQTGTSRASGGAGKVSMQDFHFTMKVNKASPTLFLAAATGEHLKKVELALAKSGQDYMKWTFTDVMVSSYQVGGSGDAVPTDQISLNFAKVEFEYKPQKADGTLDTPVKSGWDVKANKKIDTGRSSTTGTSSDTGSTQSTTKPKDSDGDGITDDRDKCIFESETKNSYQDDDGCPDTASTATPGETVSPTPKTITPSKITPPKDSDGDGITDDNDKCPTSAETKNGYQDDDGCPDTAPATIAPIKPKLVLP